MRALLRARRGELLRLNLSVVIPALNAAAHLPGCVAALGEVDELLVVDGGSADATAKVAEALGAKVIAALRGRGAQLAAGAAAARGDWLLFLHADTRLGQGWQEAARRHIAEHPDKAAVFAFVLDEPAWQARLIAAGVALRGRALALPYGDQGLLMSRKLYDSVGGFRALPLMEDVDLVRRLGRGRLRRLPVPAITSAERWRRDGWWRRSLRNLSCLALYALGASPERIARRYG
ncbi:TIGR04283 family arsenosugar biosynthesis glycosyltransferase [Sphingomonas humi]|uniref:TIGR04283 family arsenosugar biosynthesis glycosyltransferase n=1 Tax=Sphingomonas humi TaxID=335630 RepID=A0ABP7RFX7_9SPHN